ncbi:MAG: hypothetical protein ACFFDT_14745 [Candidatus Hodarchaeota archaeon]
MCELLGIAKKIVDHLVSKVDGIDLIYVFGGVAQGREHSRSDLDMALISDIKDIRWEFVLNNKPIFVWSYSWEFLEKVTKGQIDHWSIWSGSIVHAKVLWYKSKHEFERFLQIKKQAKSGAKFAIHRAINSFDSIYGKLWRLQQLIEAKRVLDVRFVTWDIINGLVNILSALNAQYLVNNWGKQLNEIKNFKIIPHNFVNRYKDLLKAKPADALKIASSLVDDVNYLLKEWLIENKKSLNDDLKEIITDWPTVLEFLNKAINAAEKTDLASGLYAAIDNARFDLWAFTALRGIKWAKNGFYSVNEVLNHLPLGLQSNLVTLLESNDLTKLKIATEKLAVSLEKELKENGYILPIVSSLKEAQDFLQIK